MSACLFSNPQNYLNVHSLSIILSFLYKLVMKFGVNLRFARISHSRGIAIGNDSVRHHFILLAKEICNIQCFQL